MEYLAEIIQLGCGNSLSLTDAVNCWTTDIMSIDKSICALSALSHGLPEAVINYHAITWYKNSMWPFYWQESIFRLYYNSRIYDYIFSGRWWHEKNGEKNWDDPMAQTETCGWLCRLHADAQYGCTQHQLWMSSHCVHGVGRDTFHSFCYTVGIDACFNRNPCYPRTEG